MGQDLTTELQARVREATETSTPLVLSGRGTKSFLGRATAGEPLDVSGHAGVLSYQPKELVLTARAGTALAEIEAVLEEQGQMLPFEPPHWPAADGVGGTLGGAVASGLSGPARPYLGSVRDLVLGARVLSGRGEVLRFGGEVMKNVAGYDVSRLMVGAFGTLGVLLDISVKVLPRPAATRTLVRETSLPDALSLMGEWASRPLPVTATCYDGARAWVRLSGAAQGVSEAAGRIGGEPVDPEVAADFWGHQIREQRHAFFAGERPVWRLSLPQGAPIAALEGPQLVEWGGGQRWLRTEAPAEEMRAEADRLGGHATLFRGGDRAGEVFHPLPPALMSLHRRVKASLDPAGVLNPGRLYAWL